MSEHDFDFSPLKWAKYIEACRSESTKSCVLIPGIEYSSPDDNVHVVTIGTMNYFGARRNLLETLSAVRADGGATILAHPRRRNAFSGITSELLRHIDGIEIWNCKVDGLLPVRSYFRFAREQNLATTVGMDLHSRRQIFPMWNLLTARSEPLDGKAIASALRDRLIAPAWLMGNLIPELNRDFSIEIGVLTIAEAVRSTLREVRDATR